VQVAAAMMAADPSIDVALCCTTELTQRHLDFDIQSIADLETKMAGLTIGDGAAAWLLTREPLPGGGARLVATRSVAMPEFWPHCGLPVGGKFGSHSRLLFKHMTHMPREMETLLLSAGWRFDDVDLYLFHQPSVSLLSRLIREIGVDAARAPTCHQRYGNASTATVPLAMAQAIEERPLRDGDKLVLAAMGAGASFVMAAAVWTEPPVASAA
jgi:3-oxoacyl-[acyl-carrier-protein] synthase III